MKSCEATLLTHNKVADFPAVILCLALNCPTFLSCSCKTSPLLPWVPHLTLPIPKPPGWPWADSMSGLGRKSYLADVRHLISYREKLLCEINTRPSLTSAHTCLELFYVLQCRKQSSCNRPTTSRLSSSRSASRVAKWLEHCLIAQRLWVNYRGTKQYTCLNILETRCSGHWSLVNPEPWPLWTRTGKYP